MRALAPTAPARPLPQEVHKILGSCNGKRVLSEHGYHRGFRPDAYRAAMRLKRGWNAILVKTECPSRKHFRLQFRVTHADGGPMADLKFAAWPPLD